MCENIRTSERQRFRVSHRAVTRSLRWHYGPTAAVQRSNSTALNSTKKWEDETNLSCKTTRDRTGVCEQREPPQNCGKLLTSSTTQSRFGPAIRWRKFRNDGVITAELRTWPQLTLGNSTSNKGSCFNETWRRTKGRTLCAKTALVNKTLKYLHTKC
jgi:hypothetical protein